MQKFYFSSQVSLAVFSYGPQGLVISSGIN